MIHLAIRIASLFCLSATLVAQQTSSSTPGSPATQTPAKASPSSLPTPHTLLDGTPVKLRIGQTISSADAKVGQEIPFEVVEDVKVDDTVVLSKRASAIATVTEADHKKSMGRAGKLNISIVTQGWRTRRRSRYER